MCGRGSVCGEGCVWLGCAWQGSVHGMHIPQQILRDTVNEQEVCILLECILVKGLLTCNGFGLFIGLNG